MKQFIGIILCMAVLISCIPFAFAADDAIVLPDVGLSIIIPNNY